MPTTWDSTVRNWDRRRSTSATSPRRSRTSPSSAPPTISIADCLPPATAGDWRQTAQDGHHKRAMDTVRLLGQYSVVILPALVVAEQIGIPLPAVPALLAVGALAANGHASIPLAIGAIAVVALPVDLLWYELGRRRGASVLSNLCRLTLEPDSCVRRTENLFIRYGVKAMIVSKFLPGLTTVMPPLSGIFAVSRWKFACYEVIGVILWAGFWTGLGYVFSDAIEVVARRAAGLGRALGVMVALALAAYIVFKYIRRQLFLRKL